MNKVRPLLGVGMILGLAALFGCSEQATPPANKKVAESRRDEIQKPTQSGIPAKPGAPVGKKR